MDPIENEEENDQEPPVTKVKKERKKRKRKEKVEDTKLVEEAKKNMRKKMKNMKQRQKRIEDGSAPSYADQNFTLEDIAACISTNHEVAKGKNFLLQMQKRHLKKKTNDLNAFSNIVKHMSDSKQLLTAIKTNPQFTERIVNRLVQEFEEIVGGLCVIHNVIRECSAFNSQLRAWNIILEKRCKETEETFLKALYKYKNTGFTKALEKHDIFANTNPVNIFIGPSYKDYVSTITPAK